MAGPLPLEKLSGATPQEVIAHAIEHHDEVAISFSGAEDVVLIDMAANLGQEFRVFSLDTGRLHPETYRFIERVREFYGIDIEVLTPDSRDVDRLVREKGLFSFYRDGHNECCSIRKIEPLRRYLVDIDAWITGQRQDQATTRTEVPVVQDDTALVADGRTLIKYNPLAHWSSTQVWQYIRDNDVHYNPLHDRGYPSIGCEPCTRAVGPHQHERDGRWWWEEAEDKECGLHLINLE